MTVSEVCRRRGLAPSAFYRWRAVSETGSVSALKRDAHRRPRKDDEQARHAAELARLRSVIAEVTAENLELKKRFETGRSHSGTGGDASGSNRDGQTHEIPIWLGKPPVQLGDYRSDRFLELTTPRGRKRDDVPQPGGVNNSGNPPQQGF